MAHLLVVTLSRLLWGRLLLRLWRRGRGFFDFDPLSLMGRKSFGFQKMLYQKRYIVNSVKL
jgi:hypothetical protein